MAATGLREGAEMDFEIVGRAQKHFIDLPNLPGNSRKYLTCSKEGGEPTHGNADG